MIILNSIRVPRPRPARLVFGGCFAGCLIFVFFFLHAPALNAQKLIFSSATEYGEDGVPVLIKNLPEWKERIAQIKWVGSRDVLNGHLGDRDELRSLEFSPAVEAVLADYPEGKLLLIEFGTPQLATQADDRFTQSFADTESKRSSIYRKIGNYSAFVFDFSNEEAANKLLDKVYYGKLVQWLGEDPKMAERLDRYNATTTAQLILTTMYTIAIGLGSTLTIGVVLGLFFFRYRQKQRGKLKTFSDAGGMIRINLDGFSDQPEADD
jgi:hypothetical protein